MVYKTIKQDKYQCINNDVFTYDISPSARCLLAYMLTKPADWQFYNKAIEAEFGVSERTLSKLLRELKDFGVLIRVLDKSKIKTRDQWITIVFETTDLKQQYVDEINREDSNFYYPNMTPSNMTPSKTTPSKKGGSLLSTDNNKVLNKLNTNISNNTGKPVKEDDAIIALAYAICRDLAIPILNNNTFRKKINDMKSGLSFEEVNNYFNWIRAVNYQNISDKYKPSITDGMHLWTKYAQIKEYAQRKNANSNMVVEL